MSSHKNMTMKQMPLLDFSAMKEWFHERTAREQELLQDHWDDLVSEFLETTETFLTQAIEEEQQEEVLEYVERVDDMLNYTTIQPGREGWTECYRQYCKERPLESLPKFPAEGFRIYSPQHEGFTTQREGDCVVRETSYFKTQSNSSVYAEKGYFVRHHYTCGQFPYKEEVFQVGRKVGGVYEAQLLACASVDITYNKEGMPTHINVHRR